MGLSHVKGCCHFCKHHLETQQHLFYNCKIIFPVIQYIQTLFFEEDNVKFDQISSLCRYHIHFPHFIFAMYGLRIFCIFYFRFQIFWVNKIITI
jgi:hypothetical protein